VKFGVSYNTAVYGVDPDAMSAVARHAEDCGFESFYLPEHVARPGPWLRSVWSTGGIGVSPWPGCWPADAC
jgi:alkanesulfonate monooxygenase SsuD/methylene tetrahydromethanopterin reductase-like flavin-dependent oxidoreductase (luciferase family)